MESFSDNRDKVTVTQKRSNRGKTSKIHEYFTLDDKKENYVCNTCGDKFIKQDSSSTGNIRNHLKHVHKEAYSELDVQTRPHKSRRIDVEASEPISKEVFHDKLINLVVEKNLPFSIVDDPDFQDLLDYISKDREVTKLPGRTSFTDKISQVYQSKKEKVKRAIQESDSKVSLVVDGWTSSNQIGFQGVICRYISKNWELVTVPLDLSEIAGPHSGENMAHLLLKVLEEYNLVDKVHSVTTDNAASMDTFAKCLATELKSRGHSFDVFHQRVRCLAHVVNLCAQKMIDVASEFIAVEKLRDGIRAMRSTPQRRGVYYRQFPAGPGQKESNLPILDCKTRWNSTFQMILRALSVKKELNRTFKSTPDLAVFSMSSLDWNNLVELKNLLKPLDEATQMISVQRTPNIAESTMIYQFLFVHLDRIIKGEMEDQETLTVVGSAELTDDSQQNLPIPVNQETPQIGVTSWLQQAASQGKAKLEKYYPDSGGKVSALGMILHPSYKYKWFRLNKWPQAWINEYKKYFEEEWEVYKAVIGVEESEESQQSDDMFGKMYRNQMKKNSSKRDLDKYIAEAVVEKSEVEKIGLLKWWEARVFEYPVASKMARDYLAASGSGVPVESFFATGTDVLTTNRQRLSSEHVKQLMCLRKWNTLNI